MEPQRRKLTVLDLFSGCGGFSLGFSRAGFDIAGGIEIDPDAERTHATNFPPKVGPDGPRDIRQVDTYEVTRPLGTLCEGHRARIDVVIGGPPCQPFTRVGRAKLRQVAGNVRAHIEDERVPLFTHFLRFVSDLRPLAFVMENVHYMASFVGRNIAEEVAVSAEDLGYNVRYAILNAAWYGVPQMRERLFIIGTDSRLAVLPKLPKRTHSLQLPVGYTTSRTARPDYVPVLSPCDHYAGAIGSESDLRPAITTEEAIGDLSPLTSHLTSDKARQGARKFEVLLPYRQVAPSAYASLMRGWPCFESDGGVRDHVIRYKPRDYETLKTMTPGDQYPEPFRAGISPGGGSQGTLHLAGTSQAS
jgi:DNA (cytosine-5)-methyltransferase 1